MTWDCYKRVLGRPYFESDDCLLFHADCVDGIRALAEAGTPPIDLAVTSPPYNIGKSYETKLPVARYLDWCESWIRAVHAVVSPTGTFWLNLGYFDLPGRARAIPIPYLLWDRIPFFLVQEVVWNYGAGVAAKTMFSPRNEKFLWYVKAADDYVFNLDAVRDPDVKYPRQKKNGKLRCNPLGKNPTDVWQFPKVTSGDRRSSPERTPHPAQFPLRVIDRIVRASSNPGDIVLDPFMGSGTTAVAAVAGGRKVVGFETDRDYCAIAAGRVGRALQRGAQGTLF